VFDGRRLKPPGSPRSTVIPVQIVDLRTLSQVGSAPSPTNPQDGHLGVEFSPGYPT